jgi:SAM-dependent methyltransferase
MSANSTHSQTAGAVEMAERYYDSDAADNFYKTVWGGDDIHIGIYDETRSIAEASRATVAHMAARIAPISAQTRMLDIGAGYGGSARQLVKMSGCHVTCLNLSEVQNAYNRERSRAEGLGDLIRVVHGSFEDIPEPADSYDVVWSQDAMLHSGARARVLHEVARVLRPGGSFLFTDPMQSDDCPEGVLQPVYDRIHLESLGSPGFYRSQLSRLGFREEGFDDMTGQLVSHYSRVGDELRSRYDEIIGVSGADYVDAMIRGLEHWVQAGRHNYLVWGVFHFTRKRN